MKILMFGRGVISTQYGWAFEQAGHEVVFYVRPGKKAQLDNVVPLRIYDARKKLGGVLVEEKWETKLTETIQPIYDLIIVSVQHYQFKNVMEVLADKVGNATVLIFNNMWEEPKEAIAKLPEEQVVWGFPMAGGGFGKDGVLNGSITKNVNIGSIGQAHQHRQQQVIELFTASRFHVKQIKDFRAYLFSHFVVNAAMHSESIKAGRHLASIEDMQTTRFWKNVILNGQELLPLLHARNVDIKSSAELKLFSLPPWLLSALMKLALKFLPAIKQIFTAHANPLEIESYGKDVLATAKTLNINLPRLESSRASTI